MVARPALERPTLDDVPPAGHVAPLGRAAVDLSPVSQLRLAIVWVASVSVYEDILQKQPASTGTGNTVLAGQFVVALNAAIAHTTFSTLSQSQQNYLYALRTRWTKRAAGSDVAWNHHGSTRGRRKVISDRSTRATVDPTVWGSDEERDPLLVSLERKFGRPK